MATKHYAPSMTFTESEKRLPKREAFGTTRTGMILCANSGYGNIPINIRTETQLVDTFGYPTEYNYKQWFDAASYLKYASELYVIRPVVSATWTNAGVGIAETSFNVVSADTANLYNPDIAESTLDTASVAGSNIVEFYAKTVSDKNDIAVAVCSKEADFESPVFTETATYINSKVILATVNATTPALTQPVAYGEVTSATYGVIGHGYTIIANGGAVWYLNKNVAVAEWTLTGDTVTNANSFYLEDGVNNCIGTLDAVTTGTKTFTAKAIQPTQNSVTKVRDLTLNIVDYVIPNYLGSSYYDSATKKPVTFAQLIKPQPDFIRNECGVVVLNKDNQGYWQVAETYVGSWDETAKTTAGLSKYIKNVINKDSNYIYCNAVTFDSTPNYYEFSTKTKSVTEMILTDDGSVDYSAPWSGTAVAWAGYATTTPAGVAGGLGTTSLETSSEIFGLNGMLQPELLIGFNNGRNSGYLDTMPIIANETGMSVAIVSLYNNESDIGKSEEDLNTAVIDSLGNMRDDTSFGALTEFNSYTMAFGQMKQYYDKYNDKNRWVPISGDIAGLLTRNDAMYGPQSALAGYNRGAFSNFAKMFTKGTYDQDELSKNGINQVIYDYNSDSWLLFEFLTNTQLDLIVKEANVRRMIIYIKQFLKRVLKGNYFEFNNSATRSITLYKITGLFEALKKNGGLYDYLLICDETNNTAERINSNEFVLDIRLQPNRIIKHIIVNIINYDMGINIQEIE